MNESSASKKEILKLVCIRAAIAIAGCLMWISTFFVVLGGNANNAHIKKLGEIAIVDLQVPAGLFH